MAIFLDKTFDELVSDGSKVIRRGLSGTRMIVYPDPEFSTKGTIVEYNSTGMVMGVWPIVAGRAYRITPNKVLRMPLIENDTNPVRRLARTLGWPLTKIKYLEGEESFTYPPRCQGDDGVYHLPEGENVVVMALWTNGNPDWETYVFVRKGSAPSWEEAQTALRRHASHYEEPFVSFEDAVVSCRMR